MFKDSRDHDHKLILPKREVPDTAKPLCKNGGQWVFQKQLEDASPADNLFLIGNVGRIVDDIGKRGYHEVQIVWRISTSVVR